MKLGLYDINFGVCAASETSGRIARTCEEAGFDSVWAGEQVVLPDPQAPPSPLAPDTPILDPIGARVRVVGPHVLDHPHGWMEIRPVWKVETLTGPGGH
jgi:alkanesulfonate monooxygenase SsuD/methylene tetrahydromethanopterin reductase-like flavin-dependent oxidoreductase (luciferase family)